MTCEDLDGRLDDYVDGRLTSAEAQEVQSHLMTCADCRDDERSLREVLRLAQDLPREMEPSRDLWPGIASRIVPARAAFPTWRLAVAAALLVAASSALTYVLTREPEATVATGAPSPSPEMTTPGGSTVSQGADEATFVAATEELMQALDARRTTMAPETRAVVDRNLKAIDAALDEIRAAIRRDPGNTELGRQLGNVHRRKIEVLQRVVRL